MQFSVQEEEEHSRFNVTYPTMNCAAFGSCVSSPELCKERLETPLAETTQGGMEVKENVWGS